MNKNEAKMKIWNTLDKVDISGADFVRMVTTIETAVDAIEPEKLYRVKVYGIDLPALFYRKREDGTLSFVQGGAGLPETEFTMDEIKQRHLENCEREEVTDDEQ
ncbi:hypothetical protein PF626_02950 [Lacticaseibacillus rhamnosus]|uniref:hypothetical protein n=1 Tax=Lacticaseibacillus rhamnosus TaxID=47715 RepID=UPI0022EBD780|nr:hypothetical protein [Lacticaseibacillus rhamnosus]MDA3725688.1 hypothetical protein [Lacticaseibacillus rhamnosus]MDA3736791.1 hypothetical protein [Lacticaseibacillus rhamnosus]MDA3741770.1 hypothetical protein [Lacticaseibacillus rhamnosus]MDA3744267.1 hypothetical protein [Lacticaseibacillus rhamnosus]MDA3750209.1 hypothetical protein [Lacticaseibacillus rhamnosus]